MRTKTKLNYTNNVVNVNTSCDIYISYRFSFSYAPDEEPIYLSGENVNDDAADVLAFGLCNNTTVMQLNVLKNKITDEGAVAIIDCLKHNNTIKKLDLSYNRITINGMNSMLKNIENHDQRITLSLEYVDLSNNGLSLNGMFTSPWGVYCAIIRHCCNSNLTLCGDKGMKEYIKEITDSLQANTTLQSLI